MNKDFFKKIKLPIIHNPFAKKENNHPFAFDSSSKFLPWMVLFMTFVATLVYGASISIRAVTAHWSKSISGSITIEIDAPEEKVDTDIAQIETEIETVLILLSDMPGVKSARALSQDEIKKLLEPWLGSSDITEDIPLPRLIDVALKDDSSFDINALSELLKQNAPKAKLDTHRMWSSKIETLIRSVSFLSIAILILIIFATSISVVYATKTSLEVHQPIIELLHIIGAEDKYIAMQYAKRSLLLAIAGSFSGFILADPVIIVIGTLASEIGSGIIASAKFGISEWLELFFVPVCASIMVMVTTYFTVRSSLLKIV